MPKRALEPLFIPPPASLLPPKTDAEGNVYVGFGLAEFEGFIDLLNRGSITEQGIEEHPELPGVAVLVTYQARYMGHGIAAIELDQTILDKCAGGMVCERHSWLPPHHAVGVDKPVPEGVQYARCKGRAVPCTAARHGLEAPPPADPGETDGTASEFDAGD